MTLLRTINLLIDQALVEIEEKYGKNGTHPLTYHNTEHTKDVINAVELMGKQAVGVNNITDRDLQLLQLAASYHDIEHGLHGRANEDKSIEIVTAKMKQHTVFSSNDINIVKKLILATITNVDNGTIVQSATENYLEEIIADADLSAFGREFDIFWDRSKKLYNEHHILHFDDIDTVQKIMYIQTQIEILTKHRYYTKDAKHIFNQKHQNITKLYKLLNASTNPTIL